MLLLSVAHAAFAAATGPCTLSPPTAAARPPAYAPHRFDEDYSYLRDPARRTDVWDPLKYAPLDAGRHVYGSFGGELRVRLEHTANPDFGFNGAPDRNTYALHRTLLHADLHAGPCVRIFTQLGRSGTRGESAPLGPVQDNRTDLAQAFADVAVSLGRTQGVLTLRGGRQEMSFGASRLVSVREGANVRRTFDGARATWRAGGDTGGRRVDAFLARLVTPRAGTFDDRSDARQTFWGAYATGVGRGTAPSPRTDLYVLGYTSDGARFTDGSAAERRTTVGARLYGGTGDWDWDVEAAYQVGTFGAAEVRAWTSAADIGYTAAHRRWRPRLALTANVGSGDRARGDGTLGTFNPLFARSGNLNEASLIVPSNLADVKPSLHVDPADALSLSVEWEALWRHSAADGIYLTPAAVVRGTETRARFSGHLGQVRAEWQATRHVQATAAYVRFSAGAGLRQGGGRDVEFVLLSATYQF